jgi:hypothetical protein
MDLRWRLATVSIKILQLEASKIAWKFNISVTKFMLVMGGFNGPWTVGSYTFVRGPQHLKNRLKNVKRN